MSLLKKIQNFSADRVKSYGAQYDAFWIFMLVFYLMPPFTWSYWHPGPYPNSMILALRLFSFFVGGAIALRHFWPSMLKQYLPLFWHFTLFFWCPFRTIFILLNSSHSKGFSVYGFMGIFLLAISTDEVMYTIILASALFITPIFFYSTGGLAADLPSSQAVIQTFWMISAITFFKWVFFRQQKNKALEQIKVYQKVASTVAHEMRIPLSSIFLASKGLKAKIDNDDTDGLQRIQSHIQKLACQAHTTIDMLLFRLKKDIKNIERSKCSLNECLEEALTEYPFEKGELEKVQFDKEEDINFIGNKRLFVHVLFNLIKNSLYAINQSGKGQIFIRVDAKSNRLHFKDTAIGICPKETIKLFKEFYTTKSDGTGMGLYFCKQVLSHIGGDITCHSQKENFTEFQITFPKLTGEQQL